MDAEYLQGFYLGDLLIEPLKGRVSGKNGEQHLPPKAAEVLVCLARHASDVVPHEELLACAWGEGSGTRESLSHTISEIRHALGDHADNPKYIQTLPRLGYRLIVNPIAMDGHTPSWPRTSSELRWWRTLLRHGVIQAAAAYLVAGWVLIQVTDTMFAKIGLPPWSEQLVTFGVIGGFPLVVIVAWCFEFVGGRMHPDRGEQSGRFLQGLERNYLAIFIAFGIATVGAGIYQVMVGFSVPTTALVEPAEDETELIPVADNSVAVLRLATFDDDATTKAFSDGLSEDILDGLARIPGLLVSARGDSWSLPPHASSDVVRRRLRVEHYIEGSVRFLDEKLRVVVQFIDSETGFHLFSRDFETDLAGFGEMQREITRLVVANLKLAVDDSVITPIMVNADTENPDAFVLYMMGRGIMYQPSTVESVQQAIDLYRQALAIDRDYPAAHAGLCDANVSLYEVQSDTANIQLAEEACAKALSVAPRLPIVLHSVGNLYLLTSHLADAEAAYETALDFNNQDATALLGLAKVRRQEQRFDEAVSLMQRAIKLQPGNWRAINSLGGMYFRMGAFSDAASQYRKVVYLDPDNFVTLGNLAATSFMHGDFVAARDAMLRALEIEENPTIVRNLAAADYYLGNYSSATENFRRAIELAPTSINNWIGLADTLLVSGKVEEARAAYGRCVELADEQLDAGANVTQGLMILAWATAMTDDPVTAVSLVQRAVATDPALTYAHYYAALVYWYVGDPDMAFTAVEKALETGYPVAMLEAEPILKEMRSDSRFLALIAEHKT